MNFGQSVLAGALTMTLLILPIVIVAAREAISSVPSSLRQASLAMGATRWQTIYKVVLPYSMPGILTGTILALSRAIGETAPLIMVGAVTFIYFTPGNVFDAFTVLPIQIFTLGPGYAEGGVSRIWRGPELSCCWQSCSP